MRELEMTFSAFKNPRRLAVIAAVVVATGYGSASAQSGSSGGSIGNDDKSVSGSREGQRSVEPERSSRPSKPAGGGVRGSFDGAWTFFGTSTNCQGSGSVSAVISRGKVIGQGSGSVNSGGAYHAVLIAGDGVRLTANGRLSGNSGRGTYMRADGCGGNWTASRQ